MNSLGIHEPKLGDALEIVIGSMHEANLLLFPPIIAKEIVDFSISKFDLSVILSLITRMSSKKADNELREDFVN